MTQKQVTIKLFFNRSNQAHYIQLTDTLYMLKTTSALSIADKNGLEIRIVDDIKQMQILSLEDDKNPESL